MPEDDMDDIGINLLDLASYREMTFQNWCSGESNQLATLAASAVTDSPGSRFNPLVIVGPTGVGKTHLAIAVGNEVARRYRQYKMKAIASVEFYREVVQAYRDQDFRAFNNAYRDLDLLIVDDLHIVERKTRTQAELRDAIDLLLQQDKQVVVTSNRCLEELCGFDQHLIGRLRQGLSVHLPKPSHGELMQHFVALCAKRSLEPKPQDLLSFRHKQGADHFDVRGMVNSLRAHTDLTQREE